MPTPSYHLRLLLLVVVIGFWGWEERRVEGIPATGWFKSAERMTVVRNRSSYDPQALVRKKMFFVLDDNFVYLFSLCLFPFFFLFSWLESYCL